MMQDDTVFELRDDMLFWVALQNTHKQTGIRQREWSYCRDIYTVSKSKHLDVW